MLFHAAVVLSMLAAVAAFIVLWYMWVKKRLDTSVMLEDEQQILFPFRHFSWLLVGLIFVVGMVQIHFMRVSSTALERMSSMAAQFESAGLETAAKLRDLEVLMNRMRGDFSSGFKKLSAVNSVKPDSAASTNPITVQPEESEVAAASPKALVSLKPNPDKNDDRKFAIPAGASSAKETLKPRASGKPHGPVAAAKPAQKPKSWSMSLDLIGDVKADALLVRKRPGKNHPVVQRLYDGDSVKVTEKRVIGDSMWYGIVTPSGMSGWVDYRFLKLREGEKAGPEKRSQSTG